MQRRLPLSGHLLGGGSRKQQGIRGDPDPAKIQPVSIEADGEGGVGLGHAAVVDAAGGDEEFHARVVEVEMAGLAEVDGWFFHRLRPGRNASLSELCGFVKGA